MYTEYWRGNNCENCLFKVQEGYSKILGRSLWEEDCDCECRKEQAQDRVQILLNLSGIDPS
jgi:hypothetical protein